MQRKLLNIVILSLFILSAAPVRLKRLTVINKSGMPIAVRLQGAYDNNLFYYLRVAEGDQEYPAIETFTIVPEVYRMQIIFIEYYDPVYGFKCGGPIIGMLYAPGNDKIVVRPCIQSATSGAQLVLRLLLTPRYRY